MNALLGKSYDHLYGIKSGMIVIIMGFVAMKVAHEIPLISLTRSEYAQQQRDNQYNLHQEVIEYINTNPEHTNMSLLGTESILVHDRVASQVFVITCPFSLQTKDKRFCLLRKNPHVISYGDFIFGDGKIIPMSVLDLPFRGRPESVLIQENIL